MGGRRVQGLLLRLMLNQGPDGVSQGDLGERVLSRGTSMCKGYGAGINDMFGEQGRR